MATESISPRKFWRNVIAATAAVLTPAVIVYSACRFFPKNMAWICALAFLSYLVVGIFLKSRFIIGMTFGAFFGMTVPVVSSGNRWEITDQLQNGIMLGLALGFLFMMAGHVFDILSVKTGPK